MRVVKSASMPVFAIFAGLLLFGISVSAQSAFEEVVPVFDREAPDSPEVEFPIVHSHDSDGELVLYNLGKSDVYAVCGTYQYISPKDGSLRTVDFDRTFASPLLQPFSVLRRHGGEYVVRSYVHPSRLGLVRPMNPSITGVVLANGSTFGPDGLELKDRFLTVVAEASMHLRKVQRILKRCSPERVKEMLQSDEPILRLGGKSHLIHSTIQSELFEDETFERLHEDYSMRLDRLVDRIDSFRKSQ